MLLVTVVLEMHLYKQRQNTAVLQGTVFCAVQARILSFHHWLLSILSIHDLHA